MPEYIAFRIRRKRHEETLREYYRATTLGMVEAANCGKALKLAWAQYGQTGGHGVAVDVVSMRHASDFMKKALQEKQGASAH